MIDASAAPDAWTNDLQHEDVDEFVRTVAMKLPFRVDLEADMGGTFALQIDLGRRGDVDSPPDRAGIDLETDAKWWVDIEGGRKTVVSEMGHDADSAEVARWIATEARREGSPATFSAAAIASQGFATDPSSATSGRVQAPPVARSEMPTVPGAELGR